MAGLPCRLPRRNPGRRRRAPGGGLSGLATSGSWPRLLLMKCTMSARRPAMAASLFFEAGPQHWPICSAIRLQPQWQ